MEVIDPEVSTAQAVLSYITRGLRPVPVPHREKAPRIKGWPDLRITEDEVPDHFPPDEPMNIGLLLGEPSGDLVDIDLDSAEAVALAAGFLPPTDMRYGRASKALSHAFYVASLPPEKFTITGHDGGVVVEIRGTGQQTIVPPSVHPSGEQLTWTADGEPAQIDGDVLRKAVAHLAVAAYVARRWPVEGVRQEYAGAVAGLLARCRVDEDDAARIVAAAADVAGDEEVDKRADFVRDTFRRLQAGEEVTGGPTLADLTSDEHMVRTIRKWLRVPPDGVGAAGADGPHDGPTLATMIVNLMSDVAFFHDRQGTAFAGVPLGEHVEVWPVGGKQFKVLVSHRCFRELGRPAPTNSLSDALRVMQARAVHEGEEREVHVRVAQDRERIFIDLADSEWGAVAIDRAGWEVVPVPPVAFRRYAAMATLPQPAHGGVLDELRKVLPIRTEDEWRLLIGWMVAALVPGIDHPVLVIHGEQGTAKTTTLRYVSGLIDPSVVEARGAPLTQGELIQNAAHCWVIGMDNISFVRNDLSDDLCRLVTGAGLIKRELYTDDDDVVYAMRRVVALTGIEQVVDRPDLSDRSLFVELEPIEPKQRRARVELDRAYADMRPRVLGAVLDALSRAMEIEPDVELPTLPRMADFARWGVAVERALGWPAGSFMRAYEGNRATAVRASIESDPVSRAVEAFMDERATWQGTATELNRVLQKVRDSLDIDYYDRSWPRHPNQLARRLRRQATALRAAGIDAEFRQEGKNRDRVIYLTRLADDADDAGDDLGAQ